ncbi:MAG: hypothetical protein B7Z73_18630 [Planctomycetia bacterium 21-64-5]|nr:MAG: hypothetical protein B7Z73_18630 [Planctomycetia bacterium 21-64-5]
MTGQGVKQVKLNAGGKDLRVHKPGAQIKQRPGLTLGDPPGEWETCGPALKTWIGEAFITPIKPKIIQ